MCYFFLWKVKQLSQKPKTKNVVRLRVIIGLRFCTWWTICWCMRWTEYVAVTRSFGFCAFHLTLLRFFQPLGHVTHNSCMLCVSCMVCPLSCVCAVRWCVQMLFLVIYLQLSMICLMNQVLSEPLWVVISCCFIRTTLSFVFFVCWGRGCAWTCIGLWKWH